jgi:protein gp37
MTVQYHPKTLGRGIEWCDETRNATGGCMHDCKWQMPDGTIAGCYAKDLAESGVAKKAYPHGFEHHYWRPQALRQLSSGDNPLLIFCDSMSDMFGAKVPAEHVIAILDEMRKAPHHTYQCLTKAAPVLLKYLDRLPPNLWVGVSSPPDWFSGNHLSRHQQEAMLKKSLEVLAKVKEKTGNIVWMSAEPVSWDLTSILGTGHPLDWIIIGAASDGRRYFQPDPEHISRLLSVMDAGNTPVFYKGNIKPMFKARDLGTPALNRWREDFPPHYRDGSPIPAVIARQKACIRNGWTRSIGIEMEEGLFAGKTARLPLPVLN